MMRCTRAQEELSAYLDEELTAQEMAELRAHLDGCAECRAALQELRRTVDSVRALPRTPAPAGFRDRVMAKLKEAPTEPVETLRVPLWRKLWPVAAAIVFALLISLFYSVMQPARERSRSIALREERATREMQYDKLESAVAAEDEKAMERGAPAAPSVGVVAAPEGEIAATKAEAPAAVADREAIGKGGAPIALKKESDHLLAKAPELPKDTATNFMPAYSMSNAAEPSYSMAQQPVLLDQATARAGAPVEIVIASADPDHARKVAQGVLEKRGWLAQQEAPPARGAAMAKAAAVPPRAIQLNLPPDQLPLLRQELTRAGLTMPAEQAAVERRDQAIQSLRAAVKLEEEKQIAARQAAPVVAPAQQMTQQRSPEPVAQQREAPLIQQDARRFQRAEVGSVTTTVTVLLKFVATERAAQTGEINQAAPNPPPLQGK